MFVKKFEGLGTVIANAVEKGINSSFQKLNFPVVSLNYTKTEQNDNIEIPLSNDEETKKIEIKHFQAKMAKKKKKYFALFMLAKMRINQSSLIL